MTLCRCRHEPHTAYRCTGRNPASPSRNKKCRCTIPAALAIEVADHIAAGHWWDSLTGTWRER